MLDASRLSQRVRRVLAEANEQAARRHHEYVGTEHILLALARDDEGVAVAVLRNLGVDFTELCDQVDRVVKAGKGATALMSRPYTTRSRHVFSLAAAAADSLGHSYIGTEHFLLALLEEGRGIGAQLLMASGVTLERARSETLRLLGPPVS